MQFIEEATLNLIPVASSDTGSYTIPVFCWHSASFYLSVFRMVITMKAAILFILFTANMDTWSLLDELLAVLNESDLN